MVRLVPGEDPTHVLVFTTLGAPQRRLLGGRRAQRADPEPDPTPVPTARATVISATGIPETEAEEWLRGLDEDGQDKAVADAMAVLNRAVNAHRVAAADPGLQDARSGTRWWRGSVTAAATREPRAGGPRPSRSRWSGVASSAGWRRCARRSVSPPCWAAATSLWPASS